MVHSNAHSNNNMHTVGIFMPTTILIVIIIISQTIAIQAHSITPQVEIDAEIQVTKVIDGDTIRAIVKNVYNKQYDYLLGKEVRVRLADINAPEKDTPEGEKATKRLKQLLEEAQRYYINIDDRYVTDKYGRIIAILYIEKEGKLVNVNAKLVAEGHATIWDHENEFNPSTWTKTETPLPLQTSDQPINTASKNSYIQTILAVAALLIVALLVISATRKT